MLIALQPRKDFGKVRSPKSILGSSPGEGIFHTLEANDDDRTT
jgi:hypothetical protein